MLSEKQKRDYVADPSHCPFCDSDGISYGDDYYDGPRLTVRLTCEDCDKKWYEVFELKTIEEI